MSELSKPEGRHCKSHSYYFVLFCFTFYYVYVLFSSCLRLSGERDGKKTFCFCIPGKLLQEITWARVANNFSLSREDFPTTEQN